MSRLGRRPARFNGCAQIPWRLLGAARYTLPAERYGALSRFVEGKHHYSAIPNVQMTLSNVTGKSRTRFPVA